jgi:translation initiation factor 6
MTMRLSRIAGSPNIGVEAAVSESLLVISPGADSEFLKDAEEVLGVKVVETTVSGSHVAGSLVAMNSNGMVVSGLIEDTEEAVLEKELPLLLLPDYCNAAGNNILANDKGAVLSPEIDEKTAEKVAEVLGVECVRSLISGCVSVGSVACCTNKGCVVTTNATDDDVQLLKEVLKVDVVRTTVNHGSRFVGSGILANSKGALVGDATTPIEMGRIEDGLNL